MELTISTATTEERLRALELVLRQTDEHPDDAVHHASELLESCLKNNIALNSLIVVRANSRVIGAALALIQSDGTAQVWPPALNPDLRLSVVQADEIRTRLAESLIQGLSNSTARLAQCVSPLNRNDLHHVLESLGFEPLTALACWKHSLVDIPHALLPDDCDADSYSSETAERFEAVMQKTFVASQDCQGLQGRRSAAECLAAHRLAGSFDPELWQIFHVPGEDVGIMLCADHRDQQMWELLYLGVVPNFRKQGIGLAMVSDLLWHAKTSGASGVLVAVDDSNVAAKSLYETCGFEVGFSRQIHVWTNGQKPRLDSTACSQS